MIHREHALQRGWLVFCRRCIAVPFEPAAHDRAALRSEFDHVWQARRGLRRNWPDNEIALPGGKTFRIHFKAMGVRLDEESSQAEMLTRLNELGHPSSWANSIMMAGRECERFGVPLRQNWPTVAQLIDAKVEAEIRKEKITKAAKPKDDAPPAKVRFRTVRRGAPTPSEVRRGGMQLKHLPR